MDYAILRNELLTDPNGYGYDAWIAAGEPENCAAALNLPRASIPIRRADISSQEVIEAIDVTDFPALSGTPNSTQLSRERQYLAWLSGVMAVPSVRLLNDDGTDTPVVANLRAMFPQGTATRNRLIALASRDGSRSEQLFGSGVTISAQDVGTALRS